MSTWFSNAYLMINRAVRRGAGLLWWLFVVYMSSAISRKRCTLLILLVDRLVMKTFSKQNAVYLKCDLKALKERKWSSFRCRAWLMVNAMCGVE